MKFKLFKLIEYEENKFILLTLSLPTIKARKIIYKDNNILFQHLLTNKNKIMGYSFNCLEPPRIYRRPTILFFYYLSNPDLIEHTFDIGYTDRYVRFIRSKNHGAYILAQKWISKHQGKK